MICVSLGMYGYIYIHIHILCMHTYIHIHVCVYVYMGKIKTRVPGGKFDQKLELRSS